MSLAPSAQKILETVGKDNLAAVVTETLRDDQGITYNVTVESREDDERRTVWSNAVIFGHTDDTCSGGGAFVRMAREQERIAAEIWAWAKAR